MENKGNSLAKVSLAINVALIIAVIILFVKMPSSADGVSDNGIVNSVDSLGQDVKIVDDGQLRICYFQADSLNSNLLLMTEIQGLVEQEQQKAQDRMTAKEREIQRWQEKWNTGGQLLPSEQQKYQEEAMQKQQEIGMFEQQVQFDLAQAQEALMFTLISRISAASKRYAEANGFDYVLSYQLGQNIYYGADTFDITDDLVRVMNDDYESKLTSEEATAEEETSVEGE